MKKEYIYWGLGLIALYLVYTWYTSSGPQTEESSTGQ